MSKRTQKNPDDARRAYDAHIAKMVASAPPLSGAQRHRLRLLLQIVGALGEMVEQ